MCIRDRNIDIKISSYDEKFLKETMDIVKKNMENPEFDVKHFCEIMQVNIKINTTGQSNIYN